MHYTRFIPDVLLQAPFRKEPLDVPYNVVLTLTNNNIPFTMEFKDGQWEVSVHKQHKREIDVIIRHFGTLTENEIVFA
jgi:hypothetical protein